MSLLVENSSNVGNKLTKKKEKKEKKERVMVISMQTWTWCKW